MPITQKFHHRFNFKVMRRCLDFLGTQISFRNPLFMIKSYFFRRLRKVLKHGSTLSLSISEKSLFIPIFVPEYMTFSQVCPSDDCTSSVHITLPSPLKFLNLLAYILNICYATLFIKYYGLKRDKCESSTPFTKSCFSTEALRNSLWKLVWPN